MEYKSYIKNAGWIHDSEFDDVILGKLFLDVYGYLPSSRIRICTPSKDDKKIKLLKEKMWCSFTNENKTDKCFWKDNYLLEEVKKFVDNLKIINNKIFLIVTSPTYGLLKMISDISEKQLVIYMYTGNYNMNGSFEIDEIIDKKKVILFEFSRYYLLEDNKMENNANDLKNFSKLLDEKNWKEFSNKQDERCKNVREFLYNFNKTLVKPKYLFKKDEEIENMDELKKLYKSDFEEYKKKIDLNKCIERKIDILMSIGEVRLNAPICDMMIGWYVYMMENNLESDFNFMEVKENWYIWKVNNFEKYVLLWKNLVINALMK